MFNSTLITIAFEMKNNVLKITGILRVKKQCEHIEFIHHIRDFPHTIKLLLVV